MENEDSIKTLNILIDLELKSCDPVLYPRTCAMKETEQGRNNLSETILAICMKSGISVSAALAQLESDMNG